MSVVAEIPGKLQRRCVVFISYRPADNKEPGRQWATWLRQALETYEIPRDLVGTKNYRGEPIPESLHPVFRNEEELLADADLTQDIRRALENSAYLVVLCSPRAVESRFMAEEIRYFKELGKSMRILALMIDGEPNASANPGKQKLGMRPELECLPELLRCGVAREDGTVDWAARTDPIAVDVRPEGRPVPGWTTGAAYREVLVREGKLGAREIEGKVREYEQQLELAKLRVIARALGVTLGELTKRRGAALQRGETVPEEPHDIQRASSSKRYLAPSDTTRRSTSPHLDENVQFTVFRPEIVEPEKWHTLLAFAHLSERASGAPADEPDPAEEVARQAQRILGEAFEGYREMVTDSSQAVPREGTITFIPVIPGITFNPPQRSFEWSEPVHREEFRLKATIASSGQVLRGQMTVYLGVIILAEISLAIKVGSRSTVAKPETPLRATSARPYRKIFASYSHKDLAIVEQFEHYADSLGDRYLRDWVHLRAGEKWDEGLQQLIYEADVFQLFWSSNSMRSRYVRSEWEYALGLKRPNFIRPTYWEHPLPSSPEEDLPPKPLSDLHFQLISVQRASGEQPRMAKPPPMMCTIDPDDPMFLPQWRHAKFGRRFPEGRWILHSEDGEGIRLPRGEELLESLESHDRHVRLRRSAKSSLMSVALWVVALSLFAYILWHSRGAKSLVAAVIGRWWSVAAVIVVAATCVWLWIRASKAAKSKPETPPAKPGA